MLITQPGQTWVTDLGRLAGPSKGLSVNGALDQYACRVANIIVGNDDSESLLESLHFGPTFIAEQNLLIAVTGAECEVTIDDRPVPTWAPHSVRAGQRVCVGPPTRGLRTYTAVRGGIRVDRILGSCAPDNMLGFGTRLTENMHLSGPTPVPELHNRHFGMPLMMLPVPDRTLSPTPTIPVTDGPDIGEFGDNVEVLCDTVYRVSPRSNHVGLRLEGTPPRRVAQGEVLSRGVPVGAIEVPSGDELLILHRGRGVTAGYPVLAVVTALGLDQLAHVVPGEEVRFQRVSVDEARDSYIAQCLRLTSLRRTCSVLLREHGIL